MSQVQDRVQSGKQRWSDVEIPTLTPIARAFLCFNIGRISAFYISYSQFVMYISLDVWAARLLARRSELKVALFA
jgi:hypothetical protein